MKEAKKCRYCGKSFIPKVAHQVYCKGPHYMTCPVCGKQYLVTNNDKLKFPPTACSYECTKVRREQTCQDRYGCKTAFNSPEVQEKINKTIKERYGVDSILQSPEIHAKAQATVRKKYGVDNVMQDPDIRKKAEQTNIERYGSKTFLTSEQGIKQYQEIMLDKYGVLHPIQNEEIKRKIQDTCLEKYGATNYGASEEGREKLRTIINEKYGVDYAPQAPEVQAKIKKTFLEKYHLSNPSKHPKIKEKIRKTFRERYGVDGVMDIPDVRQRIMETNQERYGVPFYIMKNELKKSSGAVSKLNLRFRDKLESYNITCESEKRLDTYSYDFYLPDYNMLLELNPSYTHNLVGNHWDKKGKPLNYHYDRALHAMQQGYNLRCIFDWDSTDDLIEELTNPCILSSNPTVFLLNRKPGIQFLQKYGRNRFTHYPRKIAVWGIVDHEEIQFAIAIGNNKSITHPYRILNHGTRWGYRLNDSVMNDLLNAMSQMIETNQIAYRIDIDKVVQSELADMNMQIDHLELPEVFWSKSHSKMPCRTYTKDNNFIEQGWLPVEDCGYAHCIFK